MTEQECLGVLLDSSCPIARKADTLRRYCKDFDGSVGGNGSEPVGLRAIRSLEQHVPQDARNAFHCILYKTLRHRLRRNPGERSQMAEQADRLRSLARGTPVRIRVRGRLKTVTFLEMRRTRFVFEESDGVRYSIPAGAFVEVAEGEIPKRFLHPQATRKLHDACRTNDLPEVQRLLAEGADVDARSHENDGEQVPLEDAIEYGHIDVVKLLLSHGANVNARGRCGRTPLQSAAVIGNEAIVKVLLENGADVNARDYYGTPLDWARRLHRTHIADILVEHGTQAVGTGLIIR